MPKHGQSKVQQHFVPQFYLRHFSVPEKYGSVFGLKRDGTVFGPARVRDVAREKFFHDLPSDTDQSIENSLSILEGRFATAHSRLAHISDLSMLDTEERRTLASFIALQQRRTKRSRHEIELIMDFLVGRQLGSSSPSEETRGQIKTGSVVKLVEM
jgi:hypothetical protein